MTKSNPIKTAFGSALFGISLLLAALPAFSEQSPPGCSANNLNVNIGVYANNVTNGTMVTWFVTVINPDIPTSCDIILGPEGLFFICPGPDGNPTGPRTTLIPGGTRLRPGYGLQTFEIPCLVNVSGTTAEAKVSAPGSVVLKNPIQNDPANVDKTISVNVFRPCLQLRSSCVSAVNATGSSVTVTYSGTLSNCGNIFLDNVEVFADQPAPGTRVFGPIRLNAGATTNFTASYTRTDDLCGPFVTALYARGIAPLDQPAEASATASSTCTISYQPAISVTKNCPPEPVQPGQTLTVSGVVRNTGNIALRNVVVSNNRPNANTVLLGPIDLAVGQSAEYVGSYVVPPDSCPPYTDTVTAQGNAICGGQQVSNQATASCPGTNSPSIQVTKACPPGPVPPGGTLTYSGTVTNTGNITLTDVVVVSDQPAPNTRVFGPVTLAPGAGAAFTASYRVPANSCGPYTDTLLASGKDKCFGRTVTSSATTVCPGTTVPAIRVVKNCPSAPVQPGGTLNYNGTVSNTGDIGLTNVTVYNGTTLVFGPGTLSPGASANFTGSYTVPLDSCGPYVDTLVAQGSSLCGQPVTDSTTVPCPGTNAPAITVSRSCPPNPVQPGELLTYTGTVTNSGNITLNNVRVVANQPSPGTIVFEAASLAPGQGASFIGSYVVPPDSCGPYSDTLTATGADKCFGRVVTSSASSSCPGANSPALLVTRICPTEPIPPGGSLTYTGTVTNTGNITLTDVTVVSDMPRAGTRVFGPATLAPGAGAVFTASYSVPANSCGPYVSTLTGTGKDKCFSRSVTNSVTVSCPGTTAPAIRVTKVCGAPPQPGGLLNFTGTVSNPGNITLTNVTVVLNGNVTVYGPATLNPGATANFSGSYTVPPDSCGPYVDTLVAAGISQCGDPVTDSVTVPCPGANSPAIRVTRSCPPNPVQPGQPLNYTGTVTNTGNITLTDVKVVANQPAPNTVVFEIPALAPGQGASFLGSYVVPPDSCGPYSDTLTATGVDKCFGKVVSASAASSCPGANAPAIIITQQCPASPTPIGGTLTFTATVANTGNITLTDIVVVNDRPSANTTVFRAAALAPGTATNFNASFTVPSNFNDCTIANTLRVTANNKCGGPSIANTVTTTCQLISAPSIRITKTCPTTPVAPGGTLNFSGVVANTGNTTLSNITVVVDRPNAGTVVFTTASLAPGASSSFTGSYPAPLDDCSVTDTLSVTAVDRCGNAVNDSTTTTCPISTTAGVSITRACPEAPVPPGELLVFTGWITNTGNITLTNVTIVVDRPNAETRFFGPISLAPGQFAPFTGSFLVPTNFNACSIGSTLTVRGNNKCTGVAVSANASQSCPVLTSPKIMVSKACPPNPVAQGATLTFTGTVANLGNITLTNIVVVNNLPAANTVVFRARTLAPGQTTNFTASYVVPGDCCTVTDTLTVTGQDTCTGTQVQDTSTAICPVQFTPRVRITKNCPTQPTIPGQPLVYSGTVSNAGNITLTDVVVYNNMTGAQNPVLGIAALAPGEVMPYSASFVVPDDFCAPDTVTVEALSICGELRVTDSVTSTCPVTTTPGLVITRSCPATPIRFGQPVTFTATVANTGNVTLTNVVVVNSKPAPNTPVFGPARLVPGQVTNFTFTYLAPEDCNCCEMYDTLTARAQDRCSGRQVSATATVVCRIQSNPQLTMALECPPLGDLSGLAQVSGMVMNTGDIALTNVMVTSGERRLVGPITLACGETQDFLAEYTFGQTLQVLASGVDPCSGVTVTAGDSCGQTAPAPVIGQPVVTSEGVILSWSSVPGVTYRVQYCTHLKTGPWQDVAGDVVAQGSTTSKVVPAATDALVRYYRIVIP